MKLEPGQMIRDYQIIRPLGEGGMGEVWLANEVLLERQVAIKRLNPLLTQDPQFIQRFRNEARIQAQLTHENIVQLITFFSSRNPIILCCMVICCNLLVANNCIRIAVRIVE